MLTHPNTKNCIHFILGVFPNLLDPLPSPRNFKSLALVAWVLSQSVSQLVKSKTNI